MSIPRSSSRILNVLSRTQFRMRGQAPQIQAFQSLARRAYSKSQFQALPGKILEGAKGDWWIQGRRIGRGLQLYVPIVAALMFWPYAAAPIMQKVMTNL
ncbi:hypothetical protein DL98DRAFT_660421 [Cadophora sp. DSE1049]|nr:hypothetical protein DL98DRAFT_660421 [Cadophora sp. DSE1049]